MKSVSGVLVAFLLAVSPAGSFCGGWNSAPEARAACCTPECDMHEAAPEATRTVTQAQADACCALSESNDAPKAPGATMPSAVLVKLDDALAAGLLSQADATVRSHTAAVSPPGAVPRHVLLSVFLI
jgi:hypothetical protein